MLGIAHVVSSLKIGGAERLVLDLACAQLRAGHAPWIIDLGGGDDALAPVARSLGLRVGQVGHLRRWNARTAVLGALLAGCGDVLHIHNPWALRAVLPILPTLRGRVVYTRHGASPYGARAWRILHRLARPFIDHVTFVTDEARASFEATHGASSRRHEVIGNGVEVRDHVARPVPAADFRLRIGSVGRLVELKGQRMVLDAIAKLPPDARRRVELHLFGDGPERARLEHCAATQLAGTPVVFHGMQVDRERIYGAIDVLAVGSRTEGQSMAIMEAMARGLAVIATNVGGNAELVHPGRTGMLVPPGDPLATRDAIAQLLAEPGLALRLGHASHALIAARHSIDAVAARYDALYVPSS